MESSDSLMVVRGCVRGFWHRDFSRVVLSLNIGNPRCTGARTTSLSSLLHLALKVSSAQCSMIQENANFKFAIYRITDNQQACNAN
jgi:hypothetical protein